MLDEYFDICRRVDHLRYIMHCRAPITDVFSDFAHDVGKFLHIVLHEADLGVVILLHSVKSVAILSSDLVYMIVDQFNVALVLGFRLARREFAMINLLLEGWCDKCC